MIILCECKECVYNMFKPEKGEAYQYQCGNDEIEIGWGIENEKYPMCYTYMKEEKEEK